MSSAQEPLRVVDFDRYADHIVSHPKEIEFILRNLWQQRTNLGLFVSQRYVMPTQIVGLADHALFLDLSQDEARNQSVVGKPAVCQGKLDGVLTQFAVESLSLAQYHGARAFQAPRPTGILWLQRREYFRVHVPLSHNVVCKVNTASPGAPPHLVPFRVLDVSNGGVAILIPPASLKVVPGQVFRDSILVIPTVEPIVVSLEVRNVYHVTNRLGQYVERSGCRFINLPPAVEKALQRYIFTVQREMRLHDNRVS
ncbi:MAG: flagellar brake protein [Hydrogenophilus thermoluteolus]